MIITAADDECSSVLSLGEVGHTRKWQRPLVDKQYEHMHTISLSEQNKKELISE